MKINLLASSELESSFLREIICVLSSKIYFDILLNFGQLMASTRLLTITCDKSTLAFKQL